MFFADLKKNWNSRTTIRWFVFGYPKTFGLVFTGALVGFGIIVRNEMSNSIQFWNGIRDTMHSEDKTTRRNDKMVVYDGSRKD
jgi:hypothetical protein